VRLFSRNGQVRHGAVASSPQPTVARAPASVPTVGWTTSCAYEVLCLLSRQLDELCQFSHQHVRHQHGQPARRGTAGASIPQLSVAYKWYSSVGILWPWFPSHPSLSKLPRVPALTRMLGGQHDNLNKCDTITRTPSMIRNQVFDAGGHGCSRVLNAPRRVLTGNVQVF
jgi:hypothetical protein